MTDLLFLIALILIAGLNLPWSLMGIVAVVWWINSK